jgi:TonB family protein
MSLSVYIEGARKERRRPASLAISLAIHGAAFLALMNAPEIKLPEPSKSEYKQAIEGKETKLTWYRFNKELPDVTPPDAKAETKPLRATVQAKQQILASRKDAPKRTRMVWAAAPELKQIAPVESPNVLAVAMREIAPPVKAFVAPPPVVVPKREIALVDAPAVKPSQLEAVKIADATRMTKRFVAPPRQVPVKLKEVVAPAEPAPQLEASAELPDSPEFLFKAPPRPFTPPATKAVAAKQVVMEGALPNLAVVGLTPATSPAVLPVNSSPGQFAAAPKLRAEGADSTGEGKGLSVPDLFVRGARDAKPELLAQAYAAPTSGLTLKAAGARNPGLQNAQRTAAPDAAPAAATKVSGAPDPRFNGRDVYMMAIQMPNLTSYSGSWLMWYSDRTAREVGLAPVAPPVAHRKVDPKYVAAAAADRIEGKVQLACVIGKDGHVSTVELVRGLDERLNQSAQEALAKWEFTPATRHGEPVDVDVLVEIPFRLAPHAQVPF